jgi:hypothetical protein
MVGMGGFEAPGRIQCQSLLQTLFAELQSPDQNPMKHAMPSLKD